MTLQEKTTLQRECPNTALAFKEGVFYKVYNEDAVVEWETASELNNSHFDVERSFDGSGFEYIGTVGSQATGVILTQD
jgi:hypothetical protein